MSLWVFYNLMWDRRELREQSDHYVKTLCTFINPEGMKSIEDKTRLDDAILKGTLPKEPKPASAFPAGVIEAIKQHAGKFAEDGDMIVPGDGE